MSLEGHEKNLAFVPPPHRFSWNGVLIGFDWVLMWQESLFAVGFNWVLYRSLFAFNLLVDLVQTFRRLEKNDLLSTCGKCKSQIVPRK